MIKINIIAAVSKNGIIGSNNDIPWKGRHPEDFKYFRQMTTSGEIIMGRKTFESMGSKPLPKRTNIVITRQEKLDGVTCFSSLQSWVRSRALIMEDIAMDKWVIGGERLYREALQLPETKEIYLTLIPEIIEGDNLVSFPWIDPSEFHVKDIFPISANENLNVVKYTRK